MPENQTETKPQTQTDIQLVVFDLGGVFVRIAGGFTQAAARAGIKLPEGFDEGSLQEKFLPILAEHEKGKTSTGHFDRLMNEWLGVGRQAMRSIVDRWLIEPYPGLEDLLDRLEGASVMTACLSNTNDGHWRIMTDATSDCPVPLGRLDHRFASHQIGHRKPDAEAYAHVEATLDIAPESIVFFDDTPANIDAAKERGWHAHLIDPAGDPPAQVAGHLQRHGVL